MQIQELDHVGIRVREFQRSVKFYAQFGFEVTRDDSDNGIMALTHASGVEINLLDNADASEDQSQPNVLLDASVKYPGYTHYALRIESVKDAQATVESLGLTIHEGPVTFSDGKTSIFIRDPDANVIEFTELP